MRNEIFWVECRRVVFTLISSSPKCSSDSIYLLDNKHGVTRDSFFRVNFQWNAFANCRFLKTIHEINYALFIQWERLLATQPFANRTLHAFSLLPGVQSCLNATPRRVWFRARRAFTIVNTFLLVRRSYVRCPPRQKNENRTVLWHHTYLIINESEIRMPVTPINISAYFLRKNKLRLYFFFGVRSRFCDRIYFAI